MAISSERGAQKLILRNTSALRAVLNLRCYHRVLIASASFATFFAIQALLFHWRPALREVTSNDF
jgi:hypothetical protein